MTGVDVAAIRADLDVPQPTMVEIYHHNLAAIEAREGDRSAKVEAWEAAKRRLPTYVAPLLDALAVAEQQRDDALAKIARIREVRSCLGAGPMDYEAFTDEVDAALTDPRPPSATPTAETVPPRVAGTGGPQNPAQSRGSGE